MNNYIIYKYTSPSGKVYIGQTSQKIYKRSRGGAGYVHCKYFYAAIEKYGWENFTREILKENLTLNEANYWEQYYIQFYHSNDRTKGYNITSGGNNHTLSEEGREKLSENMTKNNPMRNPEIAEKVAQKRRGVKLSQQACNNISNGHKKQVECIETGEIFESRQAAAKAYKVSPSGIGRAAIGEQKTSARKHWRYI